MVKGDNIFNVEKVIGTSPYGIVNKKAVRKKINKTLRDLVWMKYMKNRSQGKCYCCKIRPIHYSDFEVGHNEAVVKGGKNHINNLRPICRSCNRGMGTKSIEWYRKKYFTNPMKKKTIRKVTKRKIGRKKSNSLFGDFKLDFGI